MINVSHLVNGENAKNKEDLSILLIKAKSFVNMVSYLTRSFGTPGLSMVYSMGKENGAEEVQQLRRDLKKLERPLVKRELLDKALQRVSQMGWGKVSIGEFDAIGGKLSINIKHNPFSEGCGTSEAGGCFFLHGYIAGVASEVMEEPLEYSSPRCLDVEEGHCILRLQRAATRILQQQAETPKIAAAE
ncbi:hypothetical protein FJY84_07235 [Candidatus Bathyarchaeota archaeon]|nr:hypothetical protein [Candidatus Bathyarchaeota archaeon]